MSKITMAIADDMTERIIQPLVDKKKALEKELSETVTQMAKEDIPKDVMKMWKTNCEWMKSVSSIRLDGNGYSNDDINLSGNIPCVDTSYYNNRLNLTPERLKIIDKLWDSIDKAKAAIKQTEAEVYNTLLSLGTTKRVMDQFPEAAPFLPDNGNTMALTVQLESVREKTKCLVSKEKACIDKL